MARPVKLLGREVDVLVDHLDRYGPASDTPLGKVAAKLRGEGAKAPKRRRPERRPILNSLGPSKAEKREGKRAHRQDVRTAVFLRASEDGRARCEGPLKSDPAYAYRCEMEATELLHIFGRGKGRMPESERNCLAACHDCHDAETQNRPSGAAWWVFFARKLESLGFHFEADEALKRARTAETKASLPAAPRLTNG